jgi:hypothetical protein
MYPGVPVIMVTAVTSETGIDFGSSSDTGNEQEGMSRPVILSSTTHTRHVPVGVSPSM